MKEMYKLLFDIVLSFIPRMIIASVTIYSFAIALEKDGGVMTWPLLIGCWLVIMWAIKPIAISLIQLSKKLIKGEKNEYYERNA